MSQLGSYSPELESGSNHYQFRKRSQMVFELARGLVRFSLACDHLRRDLDSVIILFMIVNVYFIFVINYDHPFLAVKSYLFFRRGTVGFRGYF